MSWHNLEEMKTLVQNGPDQVDRTPPPPLADCTPPPLPRPLFVLERLSLSLKFLPVTSANRCALCQTEDTLVEEEGGFGQGNRV